MNYNDESILELQTDTISSQNESTEFHSYFNSLLQILTLLRRPLFSPN